MNKICSLIRDLFPLYEEELVEEKTKKYIDNHLDNCNDCKSFYRNNKHISNELVLNSSRNDTDVINESYDVKTNIICGTDELNNYDVIKKFSNSIKKHRNITTILFTFIAMFILIFTLSFLTKPIYSSINKENYRVVGQDGSLYVYLDEKHSGRDFIPQIKLGEKKYIAYISTYTTLLDKLLNREKSSAMSLAKEDVLSLYAYNPEKGYEKLWGQDISTQVDGVSPQYTYFKLYYFITIIITLLLTIYLLLKGFFNHKKLYYLWGLLISLVASIILVCGLKMDIFKDNREKIFIGCLTLIGFLIVIYLKKYIEFKDGSN